MVRKVNFQGRKFLRGGEFVRAQVRLRYSGKFKMPKIGLKDKIKKRIRDPMKVNGHKEDILTALARNYEDSSL